ncbi:MAG: 4-alpha-glucanotransferase [Actinomycetota bacterium]|nr:4-alpha-glucanotransferase [Actinomycetota bacterium]
MASEYRDAGGELRRPPDATLTAVLEAMGATTERPPATTPVATASPGGPTGVDGPTELTTEDGGNIRLDAGACLPPDLPFGYHTLVALDDGHERTLVVSPGACQLPASALWGWAVQLYATRSGQSWGIGDLADLGDLARWSSTELGAGLLLVNPLHAATPVLPQATSPYFPSSRRFRNPLFLRIEDVPGIAALGPEVDELAAAGRRLNADRRIDRDSVFRLKMAALDTIWSRLGGGRRFERWNAEQGPDLEAYATFCVLAEEHGRSWRNWPDDLRHPGGTGIAGFRRRHRARVDFHRWLQWLLDVQLAAASADLAIVHDLAVGFDPDGADAWEWQDVVAPGMSVGAPPDEFNTQGQDWGLPPFDPWRLRNASYRPFVETVRSAFRHAGGLRLDHVMGLFRLFWVPVGTGPSEGTYVRYPGSDLLDIVALESHRAQAWVVGEDLGTVEDEVRRELAAHDVLSYRLFWFEKGDPSTYPTKALAAVTTHDLPTIAGLWSGADLAAQQELNMAPNTEATAAMRARVGDVAGAADSAPVEDVVAGVYGALARAPSLLVTAGIDDALCIEERPNMPGTIDEWPNWSIALPVSIEEIKSDPRPRVIADLLGRRSSHG